MTTTVPVTGGELPAVSVKTAGEIPKDKIFACIRATEGGDGPRPGDPGVR